MKWEIRLIPARNSFSHFFSFFLLKKYEVESEKLTPIEDGFEYGKNWSGSSSLSIGILQKQKRNCVLAPHRHSSWEYVFLYSFVYFVAIQMGNDRINDRWWWFDVDEANHRKCSGGAGNMRVVMTITYFAKWKMAL